MNSKVSIRLLAAQSDRRLLELVAGGHERAFEALVQRYRGELLRYCRRLGLSESRAEDAVQQGLLRAWLALERGDDVHELRAWLYRIVHNTAVNIMRRAPEDHTPLTDTTSVQSASGAEVDFERTIAVRDTLTDVAALPPMQREAILLTAVAGRSHEEVASALGITHGAVRGLIYRARATLRGAAAALTPQPLIGWLYGGAAKVTPTAQKLAELSAQGGAGSNAPATLVRGAAIAVTAVVLVASAEQAPLHRHVAHHTKTYSHPAQLTAQTIAAPASSATRSEAVVHVTTRGSRGAQVRKGGGARLYATSVQPSRSSGRAPHEQAPSRRSTRGSRRDEPATVAPSDGSTAHQDPPSATLASSAGAGEDGSTSGGSGSGGGQQPSSGGGSGGTKHNPGSGSGVSDDPANDGSGSKGSDDPKEEAERERSGATTEPSGG